MGWGPRLHGEEVKRTQSTHHSLSPEWVPCDQLVLCLPSSIFLIMVDFIAYICSDYIFSPAKKKQLIQYECRVGLNSQECLQSSIDCVGRVTADQDEGMYL